MGKNSHSESDQANDRRPGKNRHSESDQANDRRPGKNRHSESDQANDRSPGKNRHSESDQANDRSPGKNRHSEPDTANVRHPDNKPDTYFTVIAEFSANYRDRGSKFLGFLLPAASREEIDRQLKLLQGRFPDATHHCYAWRLLEETLHEYSADAGEPSGTAGTPILNVLREASLVNTLLVVVRYYGGTKLGKPGLIGAYSETASACTASADLLPVIKATGFRVTLPYSMKRIFGSLLHKYAIIEAGSEFTDTVLMDVWCPDEHADDFLNELSGMEYLGVGFDKLGNRIMPVN